MSLHLDAISAIALVLALGAVGGVILFRRRMPQRFIRVELELDAAASRLVIRVFNHGRVGVVLTEAGLTCTNRQAYTGRAWCTGNTRLRLHLEPGSPPAEFCLDYAALIEDLHQSGEGLREGWVVDSEEQIYSQRIQTPLLRQMMVDLQKKNMEVS